MLFYLFAITRKEKTKPKTKKKSKRKKKKKTGQNQGENNKRSNDAKVRQRIKFESQGNKNVLKTIN